MKTTKKVVFLSYLMFSMTLLKAQYASLKDLTPNFVMPEESQKAVTTQRIGITDITIVYHSPLVKGRKIWGELVPYKEVWRAGANENTTISFPDDVTINGNSLPAGTYGLHMIPDQNEWTVIFSKNYKAWGSFFYKKEEDALRVTVKPIPASFQEWLSYDFIERQPNSAVVALTWEKLRVPFKIEVNVDNVVIANYRSYLTSLAGFTWEGYYDPANYCLQKKINNEEALKWIDRSISIQKNFNNLRVKAGLLDIKGESKEADETMKTALPMATEDQLNRYGYRLLGEKKIPQAIEVFKMNVKKNPGSWNAYDSLAEALAMTGDKKQAISNYNIALSKAPEDQKSRIQETIKKLGS